MRRDKDQESGGDRDVEMDRVEEGNRAGRRSVAAQEMKTAAKRDRQCAVKTAAAAPTKVGIEVCPCFLLLAACFPPKLAGCLRRDREIYSMIRCRAELSSQTQAKWWWIGLERQAEPAQ